MIGPLIQRIVKLITKPAEYWDEQIAEPGDVKAMLPSVLVMAALPTVAWIVGMGLISFRGRFVMAWLTGGVIQYGISVGLWFAFGYIINAFAGVFGAQKDLGQSMKLAFGGMLPVWLGQSLHITSISALGALGGLAGLGYCFYVMYLGLPKMNGTPQDKAIAYTAASVGCLLAATFIAGALLCIPTACCVAGSVGAGHF